MQRLLKTKHLGNEFRILVKKIGAWEPHVISLCGYSYSPIRLLCFVQRIWMLENALQRFSIIGNALATFPMNACNFIKWWRMIFQRSLNFIRLLRVVFSVITTRSNRMKYFQRCSTPFFCVTIEMIAKGQRGTHRHSNVSFLQCGAHLPTPDCKT